MRLAFALSLCLALGACANGPAVQPVQEESAELAPAFNLKDQYGRAWSVADSRAKPLLIDLWATWCGPCVQALPDLERFHQAHKQQVQVLGLAMDIQGWPVVTPVLRRMEVTYPVACADPQLSKDYGVPSYPYLVVVQNGTIVKRLQGRQNFADLERELKPWLD